MTPDKPQVHYRLDKILELRDRLVFVVDTDFAERVVEGSVFFDLVDCVFAELPIGTKSTAVEESLEYLIGAPLARSTVPAMCHLLAGNVDSLRQGRPVRPWTAQRKKEWVPLHITGGNWHRTGKGRLGWQFLFKIMAGTPCAKTTGRFWTLRQCEYMASLLGFSRFRRGPHAYTHPAQLVSLRVYGLIEPELSAGEPVFQRTFITHSCEVWNREIIRCRFRVDPGYSCPKGYPSTFACHNCVFGWESCKAGVHQKDYVPGDCSKCKKRSWFDPSKPSKSCVVCRVEELKLA